MVNTTLLWRSRSSIAAAMVLSEKMSPQDATLRLVVRMTEPFWYRREMTWNSSGGVL